MVNASHQVVLNIETDNYLSLKEIREEFNKVVNYYEDSKSLNSSDLSVNPIEKLKQQNWSNKTLELSDPSTRIEFLAPLIDLPIFIDQNYNEFVLKKKVKH